MEVSQSLVGGKIPSSLKNRPAVVKEEKPALSEPTDQFNAGSEVVEAEITETPFSKFLKYHLYDVKVSTPMGQIKTLQGGFVHGPGHHVAAVAALVFDEAMTPHALFKTGDTRPSRADRNEPYVQDGWVAGRKDKEGASSSKIALDETAEELGGEVVPGTFKQIGGLTPTMPFESTEGDTYFVAAVQITGKPSGDGGDLEIPDLIGPRLRDPMEAFRSMDTGEVSDGARARTMFSRGYDSIGYLPQLETYVFDHPELAKRFQTLGLGEPEDIRHKLDAAPLPEPEPPAQNLEARVNDVHFVSRAEEGVGADDAHMVDAKIHHAVNENGTITKLTDKTIPNQYLVLDYDRAKVGVFYNDPERGPMVQMTLQARPALAFAPESPEVLRKDISDVKISRDQDSLEQLGDQFSGKLSTLGSASCASAGQSDLYYHFVGCEVEKPANPESQGFVPLSKAIELCRTGQGDTQTEAFCERLADSLDWIPNLEMTVQDAKKLVSS